MTWFPQLLLTIIAACGVWIAAQQMLIARQKLNHDLFDRRFAVYVAMQRYMVACLNSIGGQIGEQQPFLEARRIAPFLFDKPINEFLVQVGRHSATIEIFGRRKDSVHLVEHNTMMTDFHAAQQWLLAELQGSAERFYPSLNLANINPFSLKEIIPVPGIDAIVKRLSQDDQHY